MIFPFRLLVLRERRRALLCTTTAALLGPAARPSLGQTTVGSTARPWSGYGHDPQHTGISYTPAAAMGAR